MRNLSDVIEKILKIIPDDEHQMRAELADFADSSMYAPPESQRVYWASCAIVFAERFGPKPPKKGWEGDVIKAWMDD